MSGPLHAPAALPPGKEAQTIIWLHAYALCLKDKDGTKLKLQASLLLPQGGGDWYASRLGRYNLGKLAADIHWSTISLVS
jgi:hypothetical protein